MNLFYLLILLLGIPTGAVIAKLAHDELIQGYKYIKTLCILSFVLMIILSFYDEVIALTLGFISIVSYVSVMKRFDKRWAVERKK